MARCATKEGRVKATRQMKEKVIINDDEFLEKEADLMGAKAAQLKSRKDSNVLRSHKLNINENTIIQGRFGLELEFPIKQSYTTSLWVQ